MEGVADGQAFSGDYFETLATWRHHTRLTKNMDVTPYIGRTARVTVIAVAVRCHTANSIGSWHTLNLEPLSRS
jgi:hypothetical protein